jgi:hypothetical protein
MRFRVPLPAFGGALICACGSDVGAARQWERAGSAPHAWSAVWSSPCLPLRPQSRSHWVTAPGASVCPKGSRCGDLAG